MRQTELFSKLISGIPDSTHISLKPLQPEDFKVLYSVASDPLIWEQHPDNDRYQEPVFRKFFDEALNNGSAFLIIDKKTNSVCGSSRYYEINAEEASVAIGYTFLARQYWGGKYNNELKQLMVNHAFRYVNTIYFHVGNNNVRSQKAVLKTGAVMKGEFEKRTDKGTRKSFVYELHPRQWLLSKMNMTPRVIERPATLLVGMSEIMSQSKNTTTALWKKFKPRVREIQNRDNTGFVAMHRFGSDFMYTFQQDTQFECWAAVEVTEFSNVAAELETFKVASGLYAVFIHKGLPSDFPATLHFIFNSWLPASEFVLDNRPHLTIMPPDYSPVDPDAAEEVWIPVRSRQ